MDMMLRQNYTGYNPFLAPMQLGPALPLSPLTPSPVQPLGTVPGVGQLDPMVLSQLVMMLQSLMVGQTPMDMSGSAGSSSSGYTGGISGGGGGGGSSNGSSGVSGGGGTRYTGGPSDSGPVAQGTEGLLKHAESMLGMTERGNTAEIQKITGKSGINPATTPWCAAFAINMMKDHGVLDTEGLTNPNYCPTISDWADKKGIRGTPGKYTPKAGDAILFDWNGDGTEDHIGIVKSVKDGKVNTIEGNSSDSVKANSYSLSDGKIAGYVKSSDSSKKK